MGAQGFAFFTYPHTFRPGDSVLWVQGRHTESLPSIYDLRRTLVGQAVSVVIRTPVFNRKQDPGKTDK